MYDASVIPERFQTRALPESYHLHDSYNVSPGQMLPVIVQTDYGRTIEIMKWGFVPVWAHNQDTAYRMINARAENIFDKPAWRGPIKHHRCLVPASGFYEWLGRPKVHAKRPFYIFPKDGKLLAFAGVYDTWHNDAGDEVWSYAIVTTQASATVAIVHDRMPVILSPAHWRIWLNGTVQDRGTLMALLQPYSNSKLALYEVSTDVNVVKNNDRHLVYPLPRS